MTDGRPVSPRLAALRAQLEAGDEVALVDFWDEVETSGTPLVEAVGGEPGYRLLTFLWRGEAPGVVLLGGPGQWDPRLDALSRLAGSDVWHRTYRVRADWRGAYRLALVDLPEESEVQWREYADCTRPDPLNPRRLVWPKDPDDPEEPQAVFSVLELPDAPAQAWIARPRPDVPAGRVEEHRVRSERLGNERRVWVYTPPGYTLEGEAYGLLVLFDGWVWASAMPVAPTLDSLLAAGQTPPLVAVMVDSQDRSVELPCHRPFVEFLVEELLPWTRQGWHVTEDPARVIVAGQSYGGLAAAFAGLEAPGSFGNVLGQSTSCWWKGTTEFDLEAEWLTREYVRRPRVPIRLYLEVGLLESGRSLLACNRHFRDVLELKGYELVYREYNGGHDYVCWRGGLAAGLIALAGRNARPASGG